MAKPKRKEKPHNTRELALLQRAVTAERKLEALDKLLDLLLELLKEDLQQMVEGAVGDEVSNLDIQIN